ncbi:hypothetical protein OPQ81_002960 [Rhizoctonia solani]|nr:hypothetical protein OPQ81_002960 [Rhizoctonia solani]
MGRGGRLQRARQDDIEDVPFRRGSGCWRGSARTSGVHARPQCRIGRRILRGVGGWLAKGGSAQRIYSLGDIPKPVVQDTMDYDGTVRDEGKCRRCYVAINSGSAAVPGTHGRSKQLTRDGLVRASVFPFRLAWSCLQFIYQTDSDNIVPEFRELKS